MIDIFYHKIGGRIMSHFLTLVLLNKEDKEIIEEKVVELLAPFDENMEVTPYIRETKQQLTEEYNQCMDDVRNKPESYLAKLQAKEKDSNGNSIDLLRMTLEEFNDWYHGKRLYDNEGNYLSTYNPNSKWDWYRIGGRWDGEIQSNRRRSEGGFNFSDDHEQVQYNVCDVNELPEDLHSFAIVTPQGEWIERGQMGWWGMTSGEKDQEVWQQQFKAIMNKYSDCTVVACDLHI